MAIMRLVLIFINYIIFKLQFQIEIYLIFNGNYEAGLNFPKLHYF
jgi:hypothetical protein